MTALAVLALGVAILRSNRREILAAGTLVAFVLAPVLGIGLSLGLAVWMIMKRRPRSSGFNDDEAMLAELTALGLGAGLTFTAAASAAADSVPGEASTQLRQAIRSGARMDGDTVDRRSLMVVVHRALLTGAPLQPAVSGYATTLRNEERSRELTAARRLPVKLLFPLALLILPGFLILTIGPAVLGSLERLGI
jgi:tight adherence protein C